MSAKLIKQFCGVTGLDSRSAMAFFNGDSINNVELALDKFYQSCPEKRPKTTSTSTSTSTNNPSSSPTVLPLFAPSAHLSMSSEAVRLKGLALKGVVRSVAADYQVSLVYCNTSQHPVECVFTFAHDSAAVYSMSVETSDGQRVEAVAQEREDALDTYDDAISSGGKGILLEATTPSSFLLSMGNLGAGEDLLVSFRYCTVLSFDPLGAILLDVPLTAYCPALWAVPSGVFDSRVPRGLTLDLAVDSGAPFKTIQCTSGHDASTSTMGDICKNCTKPSCRITSRSLARIQPRPNGVRRNSTTQEGAAETSKIHLREAEGPCEAFKMRIELVDARQATGVVETGPQRSAMLCTFLPAVTLADDEDSLSEIIFLVDRSASMQGARLEQTKNALQGFLRALPEGCYFNVVSFGSRMEMLWRQSVEYTQETFYKASRAVSRFKATLGGTQLVAPLRAILEEPLVEQMPRQIILLTDGDVENVSEVLSLVATRNTNREERPRVFCVGVGAEAGRQLCEGLSAATGGLAEFVDESAERIEQKCEAQLARCLSPIITRVSLECPGLPLVRTTPSSLLVFHEQPLVVFAEFSAPLKSSLLRGKQPVLVAHLAGGATRRYPVSLDAYPQKSLLLQRLLLASLLGEGRLSAEESLRGALALSLVCPQVSLVARAEGRVAASGSLATASILHTEHREHQGVASNIQQQEKQKQQKQEKETRGPIQQQKRQVNYAEEDAEECESVYWATPAPASHSVGGGILSGRAMGRGPTAPRREASRKKKSVSSSSSAFKRPEVSRNDQSRSIDILVQLQAYSGAYELSEELAALLGLPLVELQQAASQQGASEEAWATALALAAFETRYPRQALLVAKKARKALIRIVKGRKIAEPLVQRAKQMLS